MKDKRMTNIQLPKASFRKDFFWYFLASFAPLLLGFIKTPVFTRHFTKVDFGNLGIISITFTFLGMLLFSWIGSCIWRYYTRYKQEKALKFLYSNLIFLYTISFVALTLISWIWYVSAKIELNKTLILYSLFQLIFNQLFLYYMVVIRLMGKARFYTIFQSIKSFVGLTLALLLVFYKDMDISALVLSLVLVDLISVVFLTFYNPANVRFSYRAINKTILLELLKYGSLGLILNISLLTVTYSDRYIIALYHDIEYVGIYDQVYKISQLTVMALITIFFNTINPKLLSLLESNYDGSLKYISKYIYSFVLFGVPIVFYLSVFSPEIASVLLGKEFREGYIIMPFIFVATYLHGVSNFFELRMKFANKMKRLGLIAISTALVNVILNLIFVGLYGYQWAAYTTMVSYALMLFIFYISDPQVLNGLSTQKKEIYGILGLLTIQYVLYQFIVDKFRIQLEIRIVIGLIFVLTFFLIFRKTMLKAEIPVN
jgi:O-antigen/teichoic acid export membrane protein